MADEEFCAEVVAKTIKANGAVNYLVSNAFAFTATMMETQRISAGKR